MKKIIVFGLGYVGLPLALAIAKGRDVIGYDINIQKIKAYRNNIDPSGECEGQDFLSVKNNITFTDNASCLDIEKIVIVTVPTPVDKGNVPDLSHLTSACEIIGKHLVKNDLIIFESTVYPGVTEEICVPILEKISKLEHIADFNVGYSPERINPGDKTRSLGDVVKIISGDTKDSLSAVEAVYAPVIHAGLHHAENIKIAETAKVIENTQRDLNIALMNELSLICNKLDINTFQVLEAAKTKWNFLPFFPGLVGGHCIGVDPYYLTYKAQQMGYYPELTLASRRVNDSMANFVAEKLVKKLLVNKFSLGASRVLIMGMTFKENVRDSRNSKSLVLKEILETYGLRVETWDPMVEDGATDYKAIPPEKKYEAVILAVPHEQFTLMYKFIETELLTEAGLVFDLKGTWQDKLSSSLGSRYLTL